MKRQVGKLPNKKRKVDVVNKIPAKIRAVDATPAADFAAGIPSKSSQEASVAADRKVRIIVELLRHKRFALASYQKEYELSLRSFQRDLQQLRAIGEQDKFKISVLKKGAYVELETLDANIVALQRRGAEIEELVGRAVRASGKPIAAATGYLTKPDENVGAQFYHTVVPIQIDGGEISVVALSEALKAAWISKALVRFTYPDKEAVGGSRERMVEPRRLLHRSGIDYLVAYDPEKKDWRIFALSRFGSMPVRAGTNHNFNRTIPPQYTSEDVLGFMKSREQSVEVTVELSQSVAASAVSRQWQVAQRVEPLEGGRARIVFTVGEPSEVVRWAFGFGNDAKIVAPPQTVRLARDMARAIAMQHEIETPE